jgi:hypothetical protein
MSWSAERLSGTYRDPEIVRIASVVPSPEPDDRVGSILIPQQQLVVLTRVHLGLSPLPGVPILQSDKGTLQAAGLKNRRSPKLYINNPKIFRGFVFLKALKSMITPSGTSSNAD